MHNEATRREKSVREKSRRETTDKQNDREGKGENLKIYSAGNRRLSPTTWLLVKNQSLTHLRARFGDLRHHCNIIRSSPRPRYNRHHALPSGIYLHMCGNIPLRWLDMKQHIFILLSVPVLENTSSASSGKHELLGVGEERCRAG